MKKEFLQRFITGSLFVAAVIVLYFSPPEFFTVSVGLILTYILFCEWPLFYRHSLFFKLLTPLYPTMPFFCLIFLHNSCYKQILIFLYFCMISFDTGAYVFGKLFGKHLLMPRLSPGKTWEGLFGGLATTLFLWLSRAFYFFNLDFLAQKIAILIATCFLALCGDLFESALKRRVGIKDSGNFLPGHGGFLDRLDSLLFAAPIFYLLRKKVYFLFCI